METRHLAQSHAPNTNAYAILSKPVSSEITLKNITVCNSGTTAITFAIFMNVAGTTLDKTCALYMNTVLNAALSQVIEWKDGMCFKVGSAGTLGIQANTANVATFTVNGTVR